MIVTAQKSVERKGSIINRLFVSSGKMSVYQGIGLLFGFYFQAFLSHTCGANGLGAFTLFVSWLGILSVITVPGLEGALVYFLPRYSSDAHSRRKVLRVCISIAVGITLLCAGVLIAVGGRIFAWIGLPSNARIAFVFSLIVFSFGKLLDSVFLGMRDAPSVGYFNIIRTVARFVFCLPIFFCPKASWTILFCAVALEGSLTSYLRYRRLNRRFPELLAHQEDREPEQLLTTKRIVGIVFPMFGISIIDTLYPFLDKALLGMMVSLEAVGIYRVSESTASLCSVFVSPFIAFWPYISELFTSNKLDELRDAYRRINLLIIALMIPFGLALIELSGLVLSLFGSKFAIQGSTAFLVLAIGFAVDAIAGPAGAVLKLTKHSRLSFLINLLLLVLYFGLSFVLARQYGLLGVAVAKTAVMILGNFTNVVANYWLIGIFPYTLKHAWLLGFGAFIQIARFVVASELGLGSHNHLLIALGEVAIFVCFAGTVLRTEIRQVVEQVRILLSTELKGMS